MRSWLGERGDWEMGSCVGCGKKIPLLKMLCDTCKRENDLLAEPKDKKRTMREKDE